MNYDSTPRRPRPSIHGGEYAVLSGHPRIWRDHEFIVPTDRPNEIYRGNNVDTFAKLTPLASAITKRTAVVKNSTATLTASDVKGGFITSTSAAATTLTLPTATALATALGATRGTDLEFIVDNSTGANTVTVAVGTGITAGTAVVTGSDTLTVAAGAVGCFRIYFVSATAAKIFRVF